MIVDNYARSYSVSVALASHRWRLRKVDPGMQDGVRMMSVGVI